MRFSSLKKASDFKVEDWLKKELELSSYQISKLHQHEIVRFSPFEFYVRRDKTKNPWIRLTIVIFPIVWILLFIGLPINYLFTGRWGYSKIEWVSKWMNILNL